MSYIEEFVITNSLGGTSVYTRATLKGAVDLVMHNVTVHKWTWGEVRGCHGEGDVLFRAETDVQMVVFPKVVSAAKPYLERWMSGTLVWRPEC